MSNLKSNKAGNTSSQSPTLFQRVRNKKFGVGHLAATILISGVVYFGVGEAWTSYRNYNLLWRWVADVELERQVAQRQGKWPSAAALKTAFAAKNEENKESTSTTVTTTSVPETTTTLDKND